MFSSALAKQVLSPLPIFQMGKLCCRGELSAMQTLPEKVGSKTTALPSSAQPRDRALLFPGSSPLGSVKPRWGHSERNGGHKGLQCPRGAGCTWPALGTGPGCGSCFPPAVPRLGQPRSAGCSVCHPKHLLKSLWTSCDESYLYPVTVNGNRKHGN